MFKQFWICLLIFVAGVCLDSNVASAQTAQAPFPPGKLVDIGTHKLHLHCSGTGEPTVILESGLGGYSPEWGLVQPQVAKFARVCTYDRASYAWSENGPEPRELRVSVEELRRLLEKAKLKGPYVLVGQSWGGRIVRVFAHNYPNETAGMVLIDTFTEGSSKVPEKLLGFDIVAEPDDDPIDRLPPPSQSNLIWARGKKRQGDITNEDPTALVLSTTSDSKSPLGDRPLIVISAGQLSLSPEERKNAALVRQQIRKHVEGEAFLASLSRNSEFIIATRSFHKVHLYEPDLVADAIRRVVWSVRSRKRLK